MKKLMIISLFLLGTTVPYCMLDAGCNCKKIKARRAARKKAREKRTQKPKKQNPTKKNNPT